eukprot:gene7173-2137_t
MCMVRLSTVARKGILESWSAVARCWNMCDRTLLPCTSHIAYQGGALGGKHPKGTLYGTRCLALAQYAPRLMLSNHGGTCTGSGPLLLPAQPVTSAEAERWGVDVTRGSPKMHVRTVTLAPDGLQSIRWQNLVITMAGPTALSAGLRPTMRILMVNGSEVETDAEIAGALRTPGRATRISVQEEPLQLEVWQYGGKEFPRIPITLAEAAVLRALSHRR